jgi:regulatory protein
MANHEWSLVALRSKAEAYCAGAEHCVWEVKQKLQQWGASSEQTEQVIAHLQAERFVDEGRYCQAFVHDKLLYQGWGRMKMRAQLQARHLPSQAIEQALNDIDEDTYRSVLARVLETKKRSIKSTDPQAREKLIRFALQRGFTYEEISSIM